MGRGVALLIALVLWWRGSGRSLGIAMAFASLVATAQAAYTLTWIYLAHRLFDESAEVMPIGLRLSSLYDTSAGALAAHRATAVPLAVVTIAGVAFAIGAHAYPRNVGLTFTRPGGPPLGRFSKVAVALAAVAAGALLLLDLREPRGRQMNQEQRSWVDVEDRIGRRGSLVIDSLDSEGRYIRIAAPCMQLAEFIVRSSDDSATRAGVEVRPLADACASAARGLEDGFSKDARDDFATVACRERYRSMLSGEERARFTKELCPSSPLKEGFEAAANDREERPASVPSSVVDTGRSRERAERTARLVEETVAGLWPRFKRCYDQGLRDAPQMSGGVTLQVSLNPAGDVFIVDAQGNEGLSEPVIKCLRDLVKRTRFPAQGDEPGMVSIPVRFVQR